MGRSTIRWQDLEWAESFEASRLKGFQIPEYTLKVEPSTIEVILKIAVKAFNKENLKLAYLSTISVCGGQSLNTPK